MSSLEDYLKAVYYDPANAGNFSGPDKLYRYVRKAGKYVISKYRIRNDYKDRNHTAYKGLSDESSKGIE